MTRPKALIKNDPLFKYLIVNESDFLWGLSIHSVGHQQIKPYSAYPQTNHPSRYLFSTKKGRILDEYQLLYITRGSGKFISQQGKQYSIQEGNMFLLFPGEWHNYMPNAAHGWDEYWIGFKGTNIDNRVKNGFFSPQKPIFEVNIREEIVQLYKQAIKIAAEQKSGFQQMLAGIVNHLLGLAYSLDKQALFEDSQLNDQINKAKIIMINSLGEKISPQTIAKDLNMGYSWFRKMFKEHTGFSPSQYILALRIQKVKEMLTNSNLTIKEIFFEMGLENEAYFFAAFKNKTAMTPKKYREFTQGRSSSNW
ncbi:transcriptional regulator [Bacteroidales bacterium]|nr:transcriptional regulator [Bacteroidales bacterium]